MAQGQLLIIGGREDKSGDCRILRRLVAMADGGRIGIVAAASKHPDRAGADYASLLGRLGADPEVIAIADRRDAESARALEQLSACRALFFTGGDQLRLVGLLAGTAFFETMCRLHEEGLHIAGTSAGAAAMSDTMIVGGQDDDPPKKCTIKMAPGFGLLPTTVIDQHFAERGRLGRLLSAVAQGPHILGIGVDEDTAVQVKPDRVFWVVGSQTVTVVDAHDINLTNASDRDQDEPLALFGIQLHVFPDGYGFDLVRRRPLRPEAE